LHRQTCKLNANFQKEEGGEFEMFGVKRAAILPMMVAAIAACQPALAQLSDSQEPGSLLVFPFFQVGFVGTTTTAVSTFAISAICPTGATCALHQNVTLRLHWVVFGCLERDFIQQVSVNGTLVITPNDGGSIPFPPSGQGYLLVWVIDPANGNAIKFDGLIGKALIRRPPQAPQADTAYNAIPIQAGAALANGAIISPASGALAFDGTGIHYKQVTGQITGSVFPPAGQFNTFLVLLTLDAMSNRPNGTTFVDFNFYDPAENLLSSSTSFVCWNIVPISALGVTSPGIFQSGPAQTVGGTHVSLLGLIMTFDSSPGVDSSPLFTANIVPLLNNSVPVNTTFFPEGATSPPTPPVAQ
jgi:hypothetical protein